MKKILVTILTHDKYFPLFPQVWESVKKLEIPTGYQVDVIVVTDNSNTVIPVLQDYIDKEKINLQKVTIDMGGFVNNGKIDASTDFTQEQVYKVLHTRNFYRQIAMDGNYDYLLQIDGDILVPNDALQKLLAEDENIICGWAYNKKHGGTLVTPNKISTGEVFESLRNGSYCLLEKRTVFLSVPYSQWEVNKDGNVINVPEHLFSHSMDAGRYGMSSLIKRPNKFGEASQPIKSYYPEIGI